MKTSYALLAASGCVLSHLSILFQGCSVSISASTVTPAPTPVASNCATAQYNLTLSPPGATAGSWQPYTAATGETGVCDSSAITSPSATPSLDDYNNFFLACLGPLCDCTCNSVNNDTGDCGGTSLNLLGTFTNWNGFGATTGWQNDTTLRTALATATSTDMSSNTVPYFPGGSSGFSDPCR